MSKKSSIAVTLVGVGIILIALAVVLSAVFAPRRAAVKAFRNYRAVLAEAETFSYLSVYDPLDHSEPLLPTEKEVRLTGMHEISAVRDRLLVLTDGARLDGVSEALSGNWDVRVRFAAEHETLDIYLGEEQFYFSENGRQYVFRPADAAAYAAWRAEWIETIFAANT